LSQRRIAVVGGGMAGLMAALRLGEAGALPTVFEAAEAPGGMIRTVHRDGWTLEMGASFLMVTPPLRALLELAAPLPTAVASAPGSQRRFLVHDGRVVAVPESAAELVASPLLSIPGRMRFLKEPFVARGGNDPEETMASFARRRFGEEAATRIFDPRASGTTGGDPEQLLARYTFPNEVEYERRAGSVLKGGARAARTARREGGTPAGAAPWSCTEGLSALPRHLARVLGEQFRASCTVESIQVDEAAGVLVQCTGAEPEHFGGVVIAVPVPALGRIRFEAPGSDALGHLLSMPHASIAVVALGYRRSDIEHRLDGHGLLAASSERRRILGIQFTSTQFPMVAPPGHVLLTVSLGGARQPNTVALNDAELLELAQREVAELLGAKAPPVMTELTRWPAALPLAVAGHAERIAAAAQLEASAPGIAFAGTWHDGLMLRDVMQGGVAAANRLLERI
jgi:oxygen-dependent protoporphyrinogen oxidase